MYKSGISKLFNQLKDAPPTLAGDDFSDERHQALQTWVDGFLKNQYFSVSLAALPKVLIKHLMGEATRQTPKSQIVARAEQLLVATEQKSKQIEHLLNAFKQRGHKDFRPIKCGQIGDFLADDFMRFQPIDASKDDGGKLNSQNYQILQKTLAYYGAHTDEPPKIVDLLHDSGLLGGEYPHPFLDQLELDKNPNKYKGLISFYKAYLQKRAIYIQQYINKLNAENATVEAVHWLQIKRISTLDGWFEENIDSKGKLIQPLPVPKNMLYQPLLSLLAEALKMTAEQLELEGMQTFTRDKKEVKVRPAISWLIKYYLKSQEDDVQAMYQYSRCHQVFDLYLDNRKQKFNEREIHYLTEEERKKLLPEIRDYIHSPSQGLDKKIEEEDAKKNKLGKQLKAYKHQEKIIRHTAIQDSLLFLFVKQHLDVLLGNTETANWQLKDMENTLLDTAIYHEFSIPDSVTKLFHENCKIRKLGELRLLARDRRLASLLKFYPKSESKINQAEVRAELVSYRRARVAIMKQVHSLEKLIKQKIGDIDKEPIPKEQQVTFGKKRHGEFLYALFMLFPDVFNKDDFHKALSIRNAFSHNEYPEIEAFMNIVKAVGAEAIPDNPAKHRKIALVFSEELERLYQPWIRQLKNMSN